MQFHSYRQPWFLYAIKYVGMKEVSGIQSNPQIVEWWKEIHASYTDDSVPWCAAFVGGCLEEADIVSTRSATARSYETYGVELAGPAVGAIAVFWRDSLASGHGHVGFVAGRDESGNLIILSGNKGDSVCYALFTEERLLGYRWPDGYDLPDESSIEELPLLQVNSTGGSAPVSEA